MSTPADANDLLHAARIIATTGRHPALVARLRARAGLDLISESPTEAEPDHAPKAEIDPDFDVLARAHGGGDAALRDLWLLCRSSGISARKWPTMTVVQVESIVGKWLVKSPWPRRRVHNQWLYSVPTLPPV